MSISQDDVSDLWGINKNLLLTFSSKVFSEVKESVVLVGNRMVGWAVFKKKMHIKLSGDMGHSQWIYMVQVCYSFSEFVTLGDS